MASHWLERQKANHAKSKVHDDTSQWDCGPICKHICVVFRYPPFKPNMVFIFHSREFSVLRSSILLASKGFLPPLRLEKTLASGPPLSGFRGYRNPGGILWAQSDQS